MRYKPKHKPEHHDRRILENFLVLWPRWDKRNKLWVWLERVTLVQTYAYGIWYDSEIRLKD